MRLIHTGTKELKWHEENDRPPYAILSHRWGNSSEEVTLQEFEATPIGNILSKPGYTKIEKFCQEASRLGYEWAWVDTCCIDKKSSSELSEAINSMYRWYEQSALCIVYLEILEAPSTDVADLDSKFRQSGWFTRGWTLQELIAPRKLHFYSKSWTFITDRSDIKSSIEKIRGVPQGLLSLSKSPREYSIAQRMSWAAKRITTRREDRAYCLLGLFGINMPLIYGEGDSAFRRLQKKIVKESNDQTIFAWGFRLRHEVTLSPRYPQLTSALADSPAQFEGCGDIVPYESLEVPMTHSVYQIAKNGVHLSVNFEIESISADNFSCLALLLCSREGTRTRIGIRIQFYFANEEPVPFTALRLYLVSNQFARIEKYGIIGRIAGCKPLHIQDDETYGAPLRRPLFAIDPPHSLDRKSLTEGMQRVTISPYGTIVVPDSERLKLTPLINESRARIFSHDGYFTIIRGSNTCREQRPYEAFFVCSLNGGGTAQPEPNNLYMVIEYQKTGRLSSTILSPFNGVSKNGPRCMFATGELETGSLSAERLHSLPWNETIAYHNTLITTSLSCRELGSDVSCFSFSLNGIPAELPETVVQSFRQGMAKAFVSGKYSMPVGWIILDWCVLIPPLSAALFSFYGQDTRATILTILTILTWKTPPHYLNYPYMLTSRKFSFPLLWVFFTVINLVFWTGIVLFLVL